MSLLGVEHLIVQVYLIKWPLGGLLIRFFCFQELEEIRKNGLKSFRSIQVDESNLLNWQGLLVPVSMDPEHIFCGAVEGCIKRLLPPSGLSPVRQRSVPHRAHLPRRVPLQAPEGHLQDEDLPPQHRREGTDLPPHHQRGELEAGHEDGEG